MGRPGSRRGSIGGLVLTSLRIVGGGRAGQSFAHALSAIGYRVAVLGRGDDIANAARGVDAVLIATPDHAIAAVAAAIEPGGAVVLHCSGVTPLIALAAHERRGSVHPLMALPNPEIGAERLASGGWFAVSGDSIAAEIVADLGGRSFDVPDDRRALYHATAAVSANHLVALLGQVERLASAAGVPVEAFLALAQGSFDDVTANGARQALTGPAARGDQATLDAHLQALPASERDLYRALMWAAQNLANDEVE